MKRNCNFNKNPAFSIGLTLMWIDTFVRNVLELEGPVNHLTHFLCGAGMGLVLIGLLYGSSKTRPLFYRFDFLKLRRLGR